MLGVPIFGNPQVTELALYLAENPCSYVFINTTLTPNQTRNLETEAYLHIKLQTSPGIVRVCLSKISSCGYVVVPAPGRY